MRYKGCLPKGLVSLVDHHLGHQELEKVAAMSKNDARDMLIKQVELEFKDELLNHVEKIMVIPHGVGSKHHTSIITFLLFSKIFYPNITRQVLDANACYIIINFSTYISTEIRFLNYFCLPGGCSQSSRRETSCRIALFSKKWLELQQNLLKTFVTRQAQE